MIYGQSGTICFVVSNSFFKGSNNEIKLTLVVFENNISKKYIPILATVTFIDLNNCSVNDNMDKTLLPHGGAIYMLSATQAHQFGVDVCGVSKHHNGKQYIFTIKQVNPMKFHNTFIEKSLIYVPIWEPTQWELNKLTYIILNLYQLWT